MGTDITASFFIPIFCCRVNFDFGVTRLANFLKILATKFLAKEAQMVGNFLGLFEKPLSYVKTALPNFGQLLEKLGIHFSRSSGHTVWGYLLSLSLLFHGNVSEHLDLACETVLTRVRLDYVVL